MTRVGVFPSASTANAFTSAGVHCLPEFFGIFAIGKAPPWGEIAPMAG
jgi:hypothetical protein